MPFHHWGDNDFDWKALYRAEEEICNILKYGRVGVHSKEKYGTLRWSLYLFRGHMHDLTHPGYVYSQYPKWLWSFDIMNEPLAFLGRPIRFWQQLVIEYAFHTVCARYPHIVKEIVCDAPEEVLPIHLRKIRNSMWTRIGADDD